MKNKTSTMKAGTWQLANVILFSLIQLLFYGYFARILPKADFGIIAIANVFIGLANLLTESGLGAALIYKQDSIRGHNMVAFLSNLAIGLFFWCILYFAARPIALFYEAPRLEPILRIMSFGFVLQSVGSVSNFLLQKNMKFKSLFVIEVSSNLISSAAGVLAASLLGWGIWALVYSILFMTFLNSIGYVLLNKQRVITFKNVTKTHFVDLFSFGAGLTLVRISNFFSTNGINSFIGKLISLSSLGVFERTFKIMILPGKYLGNVLDKVMFPSMARFNTDEVRLYDYYTKGLALVNAIMFPTTLLLILFSKEIVYILLGTSWLNTVVPLRILFLCLVFRVSVRMCDSVVRAKGLVFRSAKYKFVNAILLVVLVYVGHFWDINGICAAVLLFSIISYFSMGILVQNAFKKTMRDFLISFISPIKYAIFIGLIVTPVYYLVAHYSNLFLLPSIVSSFILTIVILMIIWKAPKLIGDDILWVFKRMRNPYLKKGKPAVI